MKRTMSTHYYCLIGRIGCRGLHHGREHRREPMRRKQPPGFSLTELLIAMVVGLIVLGAVYNLFTVENKQLGTEEVITEMQQNARAAMDILSREVRMAGYNPARTLTRCSGATPTASTTCVGIRVASANTITFTADLNGNGDLAQTSANPNETIVYDRYDSSGIYALGRASNGGAHEPAVEYLDLLSFTYLDAAGAATTDLASIRNIQITVRTIASKRDPSYPNNGGYRTYTLTSRVAPRNLFY
jgi:type IV pilus assembly protein PilW